MRVRSAAITNWRTTSCYMAYLKYAVKWKQLNIIQLDQHVNFTSPLLQEIYR